MRKSFVAVVLAACLGWTGAATAQNYPNRPITLIIPFAAGGPTDVLGRAMGQKLGEILGQTVVIENVGGAGGMLGGARVAKAAPDGYTLGLGTVGTHAQNQTLYKKPLYSANDFTPVVLIAEVPIVLIARKDLPAKDLKEFSTYAKQNQGKMQFGSAGAGSATHLGCVVVNLALGTDNITHVPYPGTGPAMTDLIGGRVDFLCEIITTAKPQVDGGTVKAIATLSKTRSPALPNVPTAAEQGVSDMEAYTWNAFFLPKGAPAEVVKKLNEATVEAMKDANVRAKLEGLGAVFVSPDRTTPEYLGKFVQSEIEKWAKPIRAAGVSAD
jgi:tripartite-type tricarboxylate transporter receptor subunit TctC